MVAAVTIIPKTQKAQRIHEFGLEPQLDEIPVPEPKDDEILVQLKYSGVCHSDVSLMKNAWTLPVPLPLPMIAGHEGTGIVVKMGKSVSGYKEGDRVGVTLMNKTCQTCEFCRHSGHEQFCYTPEHLGAHVPGTFQQYITVPALYASRIPDGVDLAKAAPIQCAGWTVYRALKETGARPGQFVVITGAGGGLGSYGLQFAKALGLRPIAIDFGDTKKEHCLKQGAEFFVDAKDQDVVAEVRRLTSGVGPHAFINLAPAIKPIQDALQYIRKTGTIVLVGLPEKDKGKLELDVLPVVMMGVNIKGSLIGSRADINEALDFVARGLVDIPVEILGLSELGTAAKRLDKGQVNGRIVLDCSK